MARQTKPTFRTSEGTNVAVRRLTRAVDQRTGRRPYADHLIAALVQLGEKHTDELVKILAKVAAAK